MIAQMLAPAIQKPITLFFAPITTGSNLNRNSTGSTATTATTTTTTTTTTTVIQTPARRLALKPALAVLNNNGSSMSHKTRQLSDTSKIKTKSTSTTIRKESRSKGTTTSEPPTKKQKINPEGERRVALPLKDESPTTIIRSRADGTLELSAGLKQRDLKPAPQPFSDGTIVDTSDRKQVRKQEEQNLKIETIASLQNSTITVVSVEKSIPGGQRKKDDSKRSLRSHDGGSRSKSELAQYFPNFDEIINPEVKEKEFLTPKTKLYITEDAPKNASEPHFVLPTPTRTRASSFAITSPTHPPPVIDLAIERIEISELETTEYDDPLADSHFEVAHRRAERQEKQLRNIERERAQHEKVQLERLQEGLLGPDWLKIMGISGVTEGDRKKWDDARDYFLKEVKSLLDKFARWKDEERRRKLVEMRKRREAEEEEEGDDEEDEEESSAEEDKEEESSLSPDPAAHQLQQETLKASRTTNITSTLKRPRKPSKRVRESSEPPASKPSPKRRPPIPKLKLPAMNTLLPLIPTGPFTSFFAKPHQRAAAMDRMRRTGRTTWAFGHPIPDLGVVGFELPPNMISAEARKASARARRGLRRDRD